MICTHHARRFCAAVDSLYLSLLYEESKRQSRPIVISGMLIGDQPPLPLHGFHQYELDEAYRFLVRAGWVRPMDDPPAL